MLHCPKEDTGTGSFLNKSTYSNYAEWSGLDEIHYKNEYRNYLAATLYRKH
jgi:hypothetical protein